MTLVDVVRSRARTLGLVSIALVPVGMVLQVASFVHQSLHLFDPAPGERPVVVGMLVAVSVLGVVGVASGILAASAPEGRRTGLLGASLGGATLVLFLLASLVVWRSLTIF